MKLLSSIPSFLLLVAKAVIHTSLGPSAITAEKVLVPPLLLHVLGSTTTAEEDPNEEEQHHVKEDILRVLLKNKKKTKKNKKNKKKKNKKSSKKAKSSPFPSGSKPSVSTIMPSSNPFEWLLKGADIVGDAADDWSGYSVSLSGDGTVVAIGAPLNDATAADAGHVRVYEWDDGAWVQRGIDIDGDGADDWSGYSVSLSGDGSVLAIGAPNHDYDDDVIGTDAGHVRVYKWNAGTLSWDQKGADIVGDAAGDWSGYSVSLSSDGSVLAIGAPNHDYDDDYGYFDESGHVRVYKWNAGTLSWDQKGADIDGDGADDWSGYSVSLSSDGSVLAIGAPYNDDGIGTDAGHVRVYEWDDGAWVQRGNAIDGDAANDNSGRSVSLSGDGSVLAIGACYNDGIGTDAGHVRVYEWDDGAWVQRGNAIDGDAAYDLSGWSVSLSGDGSVLAIGAPYNDGIGTDAGHVHVYEWNDTAWNQRGNAIDGDADCDLSGWSVSLSSDGSVLAIGAPYSNDVTANNAGHVRVYNYIR